MKKLQIVSDIEDFHTAAAVPAPRKLGVPHDGRVALRVLLIREEVGETLHAIAMDDLAEIADGIADSIVVLVGTALEYGIDLTAVWNEVHRTNMSKFPVCERCGGSGNSAVVIDTYPPFNPPCGTCNGRGTQLLLRDDGKVLKPEGWTPPDIATALGLEGS